MSEFADAYERASSKGVRTGIGSIDETVPPIGPCSLWAHGAFPGHMKTTFLANIVYDVAVNQGRDVLVVSPDVPWDYMMRRFIRMHSGHEKFESARREVGLAEGEGFSHTFRRDDISSAFHDFYEETAADLGRYKENGYGHILIKDDLYGPILDGDLAAQVASSKQMMDLGLVAVDSSDLFEEGDPKRGAVGGRLAKLKQLAVLHDIVLATTFQFPVPLLRRVHENGGLFDLQCVPDQDTSTVPDYLTTGYQDGYHVQRSILRVQCLKAREGSFETFETRVLQDGRFA